MFKIIKKPIVSPELPFDMNVVKQNLIDGMIDDSVFDIVSAVEATSAKNGDQIGVIYNELEGELKMLSAKADELARDGVTNGAIVAGVNAVATNFDANDVRKMKVEQYDTITKWINAMKV